MIDSPSAPIYLLETRLHKLTREITAIGRAILGAQNKAEKTGMIRLFYQKKAEKSSLIRRIENLTKK